MRGNYWAGYTFGEPLLLLWGSFTDVNKTKQMKTRLAHSPLLFNQKTLSSFEMTEANMHGNVGEINSFKPTLIVGYPSSLVAFSEFLIKEQIKIHIPNGIITSGETLFEPQRERIEQAFGCKVLNRYGSREMGNIASECSHQNGLHIHEDHVIVEILDENQQPCKAGELGEIVVTDLDNFGFPMIRYRIGDLGSFAEAPRSWEKPYRLLNKVEGRVFDLVVGINGNRVPGNYFTLYFRKLPGIKRFQVHQKLDLSLKILLETNDEYSEETEQKLIAGLKEQLGSDINLELKQVTEIAPTTSGKHRWVISEASPFVKHGN
jgi:phenylacetate-CoA ligase